MIISQVMVPIKYSYIHTCGEGTLIYTRQKYTISNISQYQHKCSACGSIEDLDVEYPHIKYEEN